MPGEATKLGPFTGGLHNASGSGEFILNEELYELVNLEVDTDGSLVNRPQINKFGGTNIAASAMAGMSLLGVYLPSDGRKFIVAYLPALGQVRMMDVATGNWTNSGNFATTTKAVCCIQYANKLWVVATNDSTSNGGYFDAPTTTTITYTVVASMPRGEAVTQYRERIWIACGIGATTNTSRFYFSAVADPSTWGGTDFVDVAPGNGQKLVSLTRLGQDIVLFKEHSTHKFTFTTDPRKAQLDEVDAYIGVPAINCHTVYQNNTIYVMHDNSVYELFQFTYTRMSTDINMVQDSDLDLFAKDQYGLTLHRDRLFVRYYKNLYVFSLRVKRWSTWETDRKFSKVVVIPSATVGLDTAYAASGSQSRPSDLYYFQDVRVTTSTGLTTKQIATLRGSSIATGNNAATANVTIDPITTDGNWIYVLVSCYPTGATVVVTPPAGFTEVVSKQLVGTLTTGNEWTLYKKKYVSTDPSPYVFSFSPVSTFRIITATVQSGDDAPLLGPVVQSVITNTMVIPGRPVPDSTLMLTFGGIRRQASSVNVFTMAGATEFQQAPIEGANTGALTIAGSTNVDFAGVSGDVTLTNDSSVPTNAGWGVQLGILPSTSAAPVGVEVFQARITTKTYDFDVPQSYKVNFWWGIAVATSGKIVASLVIPNARQNMTWKEAYQKYGTWAVAISSLQQWSSNTPIVITDTVQPTLGRYARKFIKLLKKVRFRQIYFTITFDVITNGGIADASLRIYDLTVLIKQKETVVKETS